MLAGMRWGALSILLIEGALVSCGEHTVPRRLQSPATYDNLKGAYSNLFLRSAAVGDNATLTWLLTMARGENRPADEVKKHINEHDSKGRFPLYLAAAYGNDEVALTLLDNGASHDLRGPEGVLPLMAAAAGNARSSNMSAIVDMLLFAGADPNAVATAQRFTALMLAAFVGCPRRVALLLEGGANTMLQDFDGHTALEYAGARKAGQRPFFPIPPDEGSIEKGLEPSFVSNQTAVELLILQRRQEELDEHLLEIAKREL